MASETFANRRQFPRYAAPDEFHGKVADLVPFMGEYRMTDDEANRQWELRQQAARRRHAGA